MRSNTSDENYLAGLLILAFWRSPAHRTSFPHRATAPIHPSRTTSPRRQDPLVRPSVPLRLGRVLTATASLTLTATFLLATCRTKIRRSTRVFYDSQMAAINFRRPGVTTLQADRCARDVIESQLRRRIRATAPLVTASPRDPLTTSMRKTCGREYAPWYDITVEPGFPSPVGGVRNRGTTC